MTFWKNRILFVIKSALILKKNLIANLINKTKTKFYCDEATDLHSKKMPKAGSDYTCLAVINVDQL